MAADQPAVFAGLSDPAVTGYYGISYETPESAQAQMDWYELVWRTRIGAWWAICERARPERLIGTCGIYDWESGHHCAETGFWLLPSYWGKGVMRRVLPAMYRYCFATLGVHRIQARVEPDNAASWHLLESIGFRLEGILRECELKNERYVDLRCYSALSTDPGWRQTPTQDQELNA